jgi:hypothetical protein
VRAAARFSFRRIAAQKLSDLFTGFMERFGLLRQVVSEIRLDSGCDMSGAAALTIIMEE